MAKRIRSRIHHYIDEKLMGELYKICKSIMIQNNNDKSDAMLEVLRENDVDAIELGTGTNRLAVLIDNFVFKIALDEAGMRDNINEFKMSKELQPYVIKTYETNELISVCEYVTVISREEFVIKAEKIKRVLAILAESYLLEDVGLVERNFCNWGYRDNKELVILDFAYIYRISPDQLLCVKDNAILEYDTNYFNLVCSQCAKTYPTMQIRKRLPIEDEDQDNMLIKEFSYMLTQPVQEFQESSYTDGEEKIEGETPSIYTPEDNFKEEENMSDQELLDGYEEARLAARKMKENFGRPNSSNQQQQRPPQGNNVSNNKPRQQNQSSRPGPKHTPAPQSAKVVEAKVENVSTKVTPEEVVQTQESFTTDGKTSSLSVYRRTEGIDENNEEAKVVSEESVVVTENTETQEVSVEINNSTILETSEEGTKEANIEASTVQDTVDILNNSDTYESIEEFKEEAEGTFDPTSAPESENVEEGIVISRHLAENVAAIADDESIDKLRQMLSGDDDDDETEQAERGERRTWDQ